MRDDVGTNEFLVRSGRRNVLDDVSEHYLPTAVRGEAVPRDTGRARANFAAKLLTREE